MADEPRLIASVINAFVDRTPVDWRSLRSKAHAAAEQTMVDGLCFLDAMRNTAAPRQRRVTRLSLTPVMLVVALAGIQTVACLVVLWLAYAQDETLSNRAPQVAGAYGFTAASLLLGTAVSRDPRVLSLLAWFALAASAFARHAVTGLPAASATSVDMVVRGIAADAFLPACLWQFSSDFPRVKRFTTFDRVARRATSLAWLVGVALFVGNLAATHELMNDRLVGLVLRSHPSNNYWKVIALAMVPAVAAISIRSRRAPLQERRRVRRLASAIAAGTGPFLLTGMALTILPGAKRWIVTADPAAYSWLDIVVLTGLVTTPILVTIAVVVDHPFDIRAFLRPSWIFALARGLVNTAAIAPFIPLLGTLYQQRHGSLTQIFANSTGPLLFGYAAAGCGLLAIRPLLVRALDRHLSRREVEHHPQLTQGLERIRLARGVRELAAVLARELRRGTGASVVALLRPNPQGDFFDESQRVEPMAGDSGLAAILREASGPLDVSAESELRPLLPQRDRDWATANDIALLVSLKHRDEEIAALLAIGPKHGGLPFDHRDIWLLTTLATAVAATWSDTAASDEHGAHRPPRERRDPQSGETAFECPDCGVVADSAVLPCSCAASSTLAALPAALHGKFVVQRRLGAGGMGIVYLAHDIALGRYVALKTLPRLAAGSVARLRDEARAMGALNHESLATIYGFEVWRRTPVLVVEYLPKGTLAQHLTLGPIDPAEMIALGVSLGRALVYMHAHGVLHRDIKPSNIGFTAAGTAKLLDFGLAVLTEPIPPAGPSLQTDLPHLARAGTRKYLPPEAFHGASPSAAFDLWALSLVLFDAVAADVRMSSPPLTHFFDRALDPSPQRRFQRATHLLAALEPMHTATR